MSNGKRELDGEALDLAVFRAVVELSSEALIVVGVDGVVRSVSGKLEEYIGYAPEEIVGKRAEQLPFLTNTGKVMAAKKFAERLLKGTVKPYELTVRAKDGRKLTVEVQGSAIRDDSGTLQAFVIVVRDISTLQRDTEPSDVEMFRLVYEETPEMIVVLDGKGRIIRVNPTVTKVLGYDPQEIIGKSTDEVPFLTDEARAIAKANYTARIRGEDVPAYEIWVRTNAGKLRKVRVQGNLIRDAAGEVMADVALLVDVTDLAEVEVTEGKRNEILKVLAKTTERLLSSSFHEWEQTVLTVLEEVAKVRGNGRAFAVKNLGETAAFVRYEWTQESGGRVSESETGTFDYDRDGLDRAKAGLGAGEARCGSRQELTEGEQRLVDEKAVYVILMPVFVDREWWGFLGFEDWEKGEDCSPAEMDALKTLVTTFGAAIKQKRVLERLRRMELGIERSNDVVFLANVEGKIEYVNGTFTSLYGYTLDEVYGQTPRILKSGKQTEAFYHQFWSNIAAARPVKAEFVNKTKDGRLVTVASSINPIVDQTGVVGFLAIQRDITEQKQLTKALELERDKVKSYMEVAGVMMVVLDDQARVEQINAKGLEILGYGEAEVIGREWFEFIPERLREEIRRVFSRAADGDVRQVMYYENPIVNKAGEERLIAWHNALLNNPDGGFRVISSGEDITERKRDEAELLVRTQELERLNKVMVGRELKMVELKEYIRQLETRVGQKES